MKENRNIDIVGIGSPILDLLVIVEDEFIDKIEGEKGGMVLVDSGQLDELLEQIPQKPEMVTGGAAANTVFLATRLGLKSSFIGKLGDDADADFYTESYRKWGGDCSRFKKDSSEHTARCLSLITEDSERTMRTNLGAAANLLPEEISVDDLIDARHLHIEGYLLFNRDLLMAALNAAKQAGCTVSLDLGSFEIVEGAMDILPDLLKNYVDIVFANEDEAAAFCGSKNPEKGLAALAEIVEIAVVKLGKEGAFIREGKSIYTIPPLVVDDAVDSTGAGDAWAAGFLRGWLKGDDLDGCGRLGSIIGAEAVRTIGAKVNDEAVHQLRREFLLHKM